MEERRSIQGAGLSAVSGDVAQARLHPGRAAAILVVASVVLWAGSNQIDGPVGRRAAINLLQLVGALAAAAVAGNRARRADGRARGHLVLLSMAALCWAAGQTYWTVSEVILDRPIPFPSVADIGFIAAYPLLVVALIVAPASRNHSRSRVRQGLDWLVIATSLLFVSWAVVLDTVFSGIDAATTAGALGIAYPLADVLLVTVAVSTLASARASWLRPLALVSAGLAAVAIADTGFAYLQSAASYATGSVVDLGWIAGWLVVAVGASAMPLGEAANAPGSIDPPGRVAGILPLVALAAVFVSATVLQVIGQPFTSDPVLWWTGLGIFGLNAARAVAARAEGDAHAVQLAAQAEEMANLLNRHSIAFDSAAMGTWYFDVVTGMVTGSAEVEKVFRVPPGHFDLSIGAAIDLLRSDDIDAVQAALATALETGADINFGFRAVRGDGTLMWLQSHGRAVYDASGAMIGIVGAVTDVTERVELDKQLAQRARQGVALAELGQRALVASALPPTLDDAVETLAAVLGADLSEVLQLEPDRDRLRLVAGHGWERALVGATTAASADTQAGFTLSCTEPVVVDDLLDDTRFSSLGLLHDHGVRTGISTIISTAAGPWGVLGVHRQRLESFGVDDVNFLRAVANTIGATIDRITTEAERHHVSLHDPLTDLPNRTLLADRLAIGIASARKSERYVAVIHISLDRFTLVNTSLGVAAGDQALIEVARRLAGLCRPGDTAARLEGDEFVIAATVEDAHRAVELAGRTLAVIAEPLVLGEPAQELFLSASVGVALANGAGDSASHLRDASIAADRAAARGGRRYELFDDRFRDRAVQRLRVETELRHALALGEIEPHYQPIVRLDTGALVGVEALARWRHPTRGLLGPAEFLDVAEASGLTDVLGEAILVQAALDAARWNTHTDAPIKVSVNVATSQLEPGLIEAVASVLAMSGLPADRLCLEIVESALADAGTDVVPLLAQLHERWPIDIHIDDFGTGHSSLSRLASFPVHGIKIDRSFVSGLVHDSTARAVIAAIIDLGHALGLEVVAEGVETRGQLEVLRELGCDLAQGWLFARAMPASEIHHLVTGTPSALDGDFARELAT